MRRGVLLACVWLAHAAPAISTPVAPPNAPRVALVIGNAKYDSVGVLQNPVNDARDICRQLSDLGFKTSCFFDVKTRVQMRSVIQDFVEGLPSNAISFIYYAGHAVQVNGENYLIPTGAQLRSESALVTESVGLTYLMRELRRDQNFLNVVILDACRNNPLSSSNAGVAQGLAQVTDVPDATMVLYATAADELALDGTGRNGIMTKNILANIREPGTVDDLFKQVSLGVQKDTQALGRPQKPSLYTNFAGQFCLVKCTDLENLQLQKQQAADKLADLQARIAAGDRHAQAELDSANAAVKKLQREISDKEKQANERQRQQFVPPAF